MSRQVSHRRPAGRASSVRRLHSTLRAAFRAVGWASLWAVLWVGCQAGPDEALRSAFEAMARGDAAAVESAFTRESAPLVRAWWGLGQDGEPAFSPPTSAEIPNIGAVDVRSELDSDRQPVEVAYVNASSGGKSLAVPLVEQRGSWRIDLVRMAQKRAPRASGWMSGGLP